MKPSLFAAGILLVVASAQAQTAANTLTEAESRDGWKLLWDGKTTAGWRSISSNEFPAQGWEINDGVLTVLGKKGGDIITTRVFTNFELRAEVRITTRANSGIKYFIAPETTKAVGYEYQILDDARHPDAKLGIKGNRTMASLYDIIPARTNKKVQPIGEWNELQIVAKGNHVEHWLNGELVLDYDRSSPEFKAHFEASKFKDDPGFCERKSGHILLQDHKSVVSFRNLKIHELPAK
jgi:hypothetical protein